MRSWSRIHIRSFSSTTTSSGHADVVTLLYKATTILPRLLKTPTVWNGILLNAQHDLTSPDLRPLRITVHGLDGRAPVKDLVSSLLLEQFGAASDNESIRDRWKSSSATSLTLSIHEYKSVFLQQFSAPVEVQEFSKGQTPEAKESALSSDLPIMVYNPVALTPTSLNQEPLHLPTTILVIAPAPAHSFPSLVQDSAEPSSLAEVPLSWSESSTSEPSKFSKVLPADPHLALTALDVLWEGSQSPLHIQRFQDGFIGSNIPQLLGAISAHFSAPENTPDHEFLPMIKRRTALAQLETFFSLGDKSLKEANQDIVNASFAVTDLRAIIDSEASQIHRDILGPSSEHLSSALGHADARIQRTLQALTWWRVIRSADDVESNLNEAVEKNWCPELERQLIWQSGRLSTIQAKLETLAFSLLQSNQTTMPNQVLRNSLQQIAASRTYPLSPSTLTEPIQLRREQINQFPTATLQALAQRSVLTLFTGVFGGAGIAWTGWVGWLSSVGVESLGTALGLGALTSLVVLRVVVTNWAKGKRRWWDDWKRIQAGFERDLKMRLDDVVEKQVMVVPRTACDELEQIIAKRKEAVSSVEADLGELVEELKIIRAKTT